jgi:anti-sigma factor RsiW
MTCRDILDFLMDYEAGAVTAEERAVFEAHLGVCPPCVAYLKSYRITVELGKTAYGGEEAEPRMPDELVTAILAARKR